MLLIREKNQLMYSQYLSVEKNVKKSIEQVKNLLQVPLLANNGPRDRQGRSHPPVFTLTTFSSSHGSHFTVTEMPNFVQKLKSIWILYQ